ncbi:hypothetical protein FRUB_01529 [Fimbriiglobus ruber]|uniref:Uncharacterized protein n=1 Tax=Fimbriiglobus ruber TaxID=1908690 RepID=A0A225E329_9BACT|nr:hypothetical protein FRUB_01529 [Fimbriiglobus ruber]
MPFGETCDLFVQYPLQFTPAQVGWGDGKLPDAMLLAIRPLPLVGPDSESGPASNAMEPSG